MTVQTTTNKARYVGDGASTNWAYAFPIPDATDLFVYYTDLTGTTTLIPSSQYSVTGIGSANGGIVTYPLVGPPIAVGTILVIIRTLPFEQQVDLINQDGFYPDVIEGGLDSLEMQIQQLVEVQGRNLTVGVTDTSPGDLPAAAARANQILGFDGNGNAIAAQPSSALVSIAMQPIVSAATLALARSALGLGVLSTEGIGSGLQDDGAGNLRTFYKLVQDNTNKNVDITYFAQQHLATGAISYTLPRANTLFNGFGFWISALTNVVSILVNVNDNFAGMASGQTLVIPPGTQAFICTDGAPNATWSASFNQLVGMNSPLNLQLVASVASNALTIAVKDRNGLDPSTTSPVLLAFRDPTLTNGNPVIRALTAALSINIPNGVTLGTTNGNAAHIWIVAFDNAGTLVLAAIVCSNANQIFSLIENVLQSTNSGGATAGQFYSPIAIANKAIRILGYVGVTEATAGVWATAPSVIQLFGPGIKKPGEIIQTVMSTTGAVATGTTVLPWDDTIPQNTEGNQYMTQAITPTDSANLLLVEHQGTYASDSSDFMSAALFQDAQAGAIAATFGVIGSVGWPTPLAIKYMALASLTTSTTFNVRAGSHVASTVTFNGSAGLRKFGGVANSTLRITEFMG